ncbi:MAG: T9SS type A sorting domain-containing protein [Chitinophagales bacterium]|nr:T9SS type A sorting domain-containing protein [Chitinophagales bacterium]
MKNIFFSLLFFVLMYSFGATASYAQCTLDWSKTYGGTSGEDIVDITEGWNGNIILLSRALLANGDINCTLKGSVDLWLICINTEGDILWQQCYGGTLQDEPAQIIKTNDYGYLISGYTFSNDGDVSFNHGGDDIWIIKIDSTGTIEWQKTFGSLAGDEPDDILQLANGKYAISCHTLGSDGDFPEHYGGVFGKDAWIIFINPNGDTDTLLHFGGSLDDIIKDLIELPNGNLMAIGNTDSHDYDLALILTYGGRDGWIFQIDSNFNTVWKRLWGGAGSDEFLSGVESNDGFLIEGSTTSNTGEFVSNHGSSDLMIVKFDTLGNLQWQKLYGGSLSDAAAWQSRIRKINENLFSMGAWTMSNDGDVGVSHGQTDFWFLSVDSTGNTLSSRASGGSDNDYLLVNKEIYGVAYQGGTTNSTDFDVVNNHGESDGWLIKIGGVNLIESSDAPKTQISIFPNPLHDTGTVQMDFDTFYKSKYLDVYDSYGRLLQSFLIGKYNNQFSMSNYSCGLYLYQLRSKTGEILGGGNFLIQ